MSTKQTRIVACSFREEGIGCGVGLAGSFNVISTHVCASGGASETRSLLLPTAVAQARSLRECNCDRGSVNRMERSLLTKKLSERRCAQGGAFRGVDSVDLFPGIMFSSPATSNHQRCSEAFRTCLLGAVATLVNAHAKYSKPAEPLLTMLPSFPDWASATYRLETLLSLP